MPGVSITVYRQYRAGTKNAPGSSVKPSSSAKGDGIVTSQSTQSSASPRAGRENAKENAKLNGIENTEFFCDDAFGAAKRISESKIKIDVIVLDPPRKGCSRDVIEAVVKMNPKRIVYVSCDPATLARDCAVFKAEGFETTEITAVDMFPRTTHVETVAILSRR